MIEQVYNQHLIINRKRQGKPFRLRKDFSKIEEHEDYRHYQQVVKFLEKNPHIDIQDFFEGVSYFNKGTGWIPMSEYSKSKAFTSYLEYMRSIEILDLDSKEHLKRCVSSFQFIKKFLTEQKISKVDYIQYKTSSGYSDCLNHIKTRQVSKYALFAFSEYVDMLRHLERDPEIWEFYMGTSENNVNFLLKRWNRALTWKDMAAKCYNILK